MDFEVKSETQLASNPEVQSKNGLLYVLPQSLSSSTNKTFIRQQAQRQTYNSGDTCVVDLNTGSRYINAENCALIFNITPTGNGDATNFRTFSSNAGAIAIINEIRIHAKSGVELDRIQHCNQYVFTKSLLKENSDYFNKYSSLWGGYDQSIGGNNGVARSATNTPTNSKLFGGQARKYVIPMKLISGLFDPTVSGMALPPGLLSGARIEIVFEAPGRVFGPAVGTCALTDYVISNPYIECMSHELSDNSQRVLNEESVENGLEYTYNRVFSTLEPSAAGTLNIQVKKAVSQGLRAFCMPIVQAEAAADTAESFSGSLAYEKFQWRIGSSFFPQAMVDSQEEGLYVSQNVYNKHAVSGWYANDMTVDFYKDKQPVMAAGFETNQRLNLSGVPINNSNTLTLEATVPTGTVINYYLFLEYVAVARSFLTNVEVKM
jgi:hypothetical protein